ncbi:ATP-binding cassette domain-containing protein [Chitinophaga caseinilytica]|uniref:ABC transporter ATP-binding protein n=1 Tax=Chitinophaga caseinilytica TaxID=2267521 RepID=UPI003C2DDDDF
MVSLQNIAYSYRRGKPVLDGLSLTLAPGRIYGLLGRNGTGKSTLLYQMAGLLFPQSGSCTVFGFTPMRREPAFLQQVYVVPEAFVLPDLSSNAYIRLNAPFYPTFDHALCNNILQQFGIGEAGPLNRLSHGQQKQFQIAFAIATGAKLLLLDEPTNGLDIPSKQQFRKVVAGSLRNDQVMVISTHQVRDLDSLIDDVLILDQGRIVLQAPVSRITERLVFRKVKERAESGKPLYAEEALGGFAVIARNTTDESSRLDMELLFNAALSGETSILPILQD